MIMVCVIQSTCGGTNNQYNPDTTLNVFFAGSRCTPFQTCRRNMAVSHTCQELPGVISPETGRIALLCKPYYEPCTVDFQPGSSSGCPAGFVCVFEDDSDTTGECRPSPWGRAQGWGWVRLPPSVTIYIGKSILENSCRMFSCMQGVHRFSGPLQKGKRAMHDATPKEGNISIGKGLYFDENKGVSCIKTGILIQNVNGKLQKMQLDVGVNPPANLTYLTFDLDPSDLRP